MGDKHDTEPNPNLPRLVYRALCTARRLDRLHLVEKDPEFDLDKLNADVQTLVSQFHEEGYNDLTVGSTIESLRHSAGIFREYARRELDRLEGLGYWRPNFPEDSNNGDPAIRTLAHQANTLRIGMPLTLFMNGSLVSGFTVSGVEFYENLAKQLSEGIGDATGRVTPESILAGSLSHLVAPYKDRDDAWNPYLPAYIHLRVKRVVTGPTSASMDVLCRFRIEQINGFCYGVTFN